MPTLSITRFGSAGVRGLRSRPSHRKTWPAHRSLSPGDDPVKVVPLPCPDEEWDPPGRRPIANSDPDGPLVLRVKRGDTAAFEELVERHKHPLLNYTTRMLRDPTEAEDVAQNAFLRVFRATNAFRFKAHFCTWLYTIARNLCLNELRRRSRHWASPLEAQEGECEHSLVYHSEINGRRGTVAEALVGRELEEEIEEALAELPEPQRTAILLLQEEELSYQQIAAILDKSVAATKSLIHRGRQMLKARLMPYLRNGNWRVVAEKPLYPPADSGFARLPMMA